MNLHRWQQGPDDVDFILPLIVDPDAVRSSLFLAAWLIVIFTLAWYGRRNLVDKAGR